MTISEALGAAAPVVRPADPGAVTAWVDVVAVDELTPGRGVAALVAGRQVAIFLTADDEVHALDNLDPFSGAHVLSRGIVGDRAGVPKVASPMYKQSFDLRTGRCLDDDGVAVAVHPVRVVAGRVEVGVVEVGVT
ncbi:MAG TPA: nitrite reductase small subunit NirD [Acidimicrobiales bacterium]